MSLKTAKKAVDFYFKNSNNCNHQISFIGGEPLLKFNLIKKIVEYIKTFNNKVSFTIITNGSLLKEDILNYLIENMFHITISFDGEKEIQGLNRLSKDKKNSFDIGYNNIRKIQLNNTRYFEQYVTINSVYSINITSSLSEFTNYLEAHFKNKFAINIQSSEINDEYTKFHNNFTKSFLSIYENIHIQGFENSSPPLFIISSDLHKKMMFFSRRSNNILQEETRFIPIKSCLPYLNKIYISPTGDIFMCSDLYYIKGFNIGNIDKSIELNKLQDIMTQYTNFRNKTCKKCWVYRFCDFCFYTLYASKERKGINKYCKIIKYDYAQVIKSYIKILKSNGSAFDIYY